MLHISRLSPTI